MVAATKRKARAIEQQETSKPALTWAAVGAAAELYWPGIGAQVVAQIDEWNLALFDGELSPVPVVLSRMSAVHGHFFPTLDRSVDQRLGFDGPVYFAVGASVPYSRPKPLTSVRRSDLLRGLMFRHLSEQGLDTSARGTPWCVLLMDLHRRLTGKEIWCAPMTERRVDIAPTMPDGSRGLARQVLERDQPACPKTGKPSISKSEIESWPMNSIDLGDITKGNP